MEILLSEAQIRPWRTSDAESLARNANNRKIWRNLRDRFPHPYTLEDARAYLERASAVETVGAIAVGGHAVGGISLHLQDDVARRNAEIGYWLGEPFWGRGIVTEAVRAVSAWAFARHDLIRLYACVFDWNPASARVLEKAGYTFEARHRLAVTKDEETIDELVYVLLRDT